MGKAAILMATAVMLWGSYSLLQGTSTSVETDRRQAERQEEVLAREIARSGLNRIMSRVRQVQRESATSMSMQAIIQQVNGATGKRERDYQGGRYEAWIYPTSMESFGAVSIGYYGGAAFRATGPQDVASGVIPDGKVPQVSVNTPIEVEVIESESSYCSAIFVQRVVPRGNNGHGNNCDGVDSSNPGNSDFVDSDPTVDDECVGNWVLLEPELVFPPGNYRNGEVKKYKTTLEAGMRINLLVGVDADTSCELAGDTTVTATTDYFDYVRSTLITEITSVDDLLEGEYVMTQENPNTPGVWRIAFEDEVYSEDKLDDVKKNGYGGLWNNKNKSYEGDGWTSTDGDGYWLLEDQGGKPDFYDHVMEVRVAAPDSTSL